MIQCIQITSLTIAVGNQMTLSDILVVNLDIIYSFLFPLKSKSRTPYFLQCLNFQIKANSQVHVLCRFLAKIWTET